MGPGTMICGRCRIEFKTREGGWQWKTCPVCKGEGAVNVEEAHGFEGSERRKYHVRRPCTTCFGDGRVKEYSRSSHGESCPNCGWTT